MSRGVALDGSEASGAGSRPASHSARVLLARARRLIPEGRALPEGVWLTRHRTIVWLLVVHAVGLFFFAIARGNSATHALAEIAPIIVAAAFAGSIPRGRTVRSVVATFGLVTASGVLVHLSGGTIEAHFHFFVMLGVISLYQSWAPFLCALLFVVMHHGVMGALFPSDVYNHAAAIANPWKWAGVHGGFVLAASIAQLVSWRFSEAANADVELLLDSAADGIFGIDLEGRITFVNVAAARMLQDQRDAIIGLDAHDVVGPPKGADPAAPAVSPIVSALTGTATSEPVLARIRIGARALDVDLTCTPVMRHGEVTGAVVTFRDIGERLRAEADIREGLSLLAATLESTADGILVVDREGRIASYNHKFIEMWQIPEDVIASRDDERAIASVLAQLKDPDAFVAKVRELYANPVAASFDTLEFIDGRMFERYSQPQWIDGEPAGRVWSFRDVTERARLDTMKNSFLSAVSHELRTPLTAVLGYAVTLERRDGNLSKLERLELLGRLGMNARKLERLVTEILDLDRLTRGIVEPRRIATEACALVRRVIDECDFGDRIIAVRGDPVTVHIDPPKVERIVENLLMNAHRHTPPGIPVVITVSRSDEGCQIDVADGGPGIPDELKEAIFEPFRQGPIVSTHSPGVGIGLALVARFAELHGGRAWVEDAPDGGAHFRVSLPSLPPVREAQAS